MKVDWSFLFGEHIDGQKGCHALILRGEDKELCVLFQTSLYVYPF